MYLERDKRSVQKIKKYQHKNCLKMSETGKSECERKKEKEKGYTMI